MASQDQVPGTSAAASQQSPLLKLPAELTNTIYRHSLNTNSAFQIGLDGFTEPDLLSTCKQIRLEASTIFYTENEFIILIHNYNARGCIKFEEKLRATLKSPELLIMPRHNGYFVDPAARDWRNLLEWLRAIYDGVVRLGISLPSNDATGHLEYLVIGGMFAVAESMRTQPWCTVEKLLRVQRVILARIEPSWGE